MKADDLVGFVLFGAYKLQGWSQLRGRPGEKILRESAFALRWKISDRA